MLNNQFSLFLNPEDAIFPAYVKPKKDELFSCWLVRLAHSHYMKVHTFTRFYFPEQQFWNRDIDRCVSDSVLLKATAKSNVSFDYLYQTTLRSYNDRLILKHNYKTSNKWLLPLGIYHRTWKHKGLVFCPICLGTDPIPYFRKHWRLATSVVCSCCGVKLHDCCPKCDSPISFFRVELGLKNEEIGNSLNTCFNCSFDLSKSDAVKASEKIIDMQQSIDEVIQFGWKNEVIYPHLYFEVLHHFLKILCGNNQQATDLKAFLSKNIGIYLPMITRRRKPIFEYLTIEERSELLYGATWLLDNWPTRFIWVFKQLGWFSTPLLNSFEETPFWYWSIVYENFYKSNVNRRFNWNKIRFKQNIVQLK